GVCWVNGRIVDAGDGSVSAMDHSIVVGDGVFETLKVVNGPDGPVPFALTRHLERLRHSADGLGMQPADEDRVRAALAKVIVADPAAGRIRITWSSGPGPLSSGRGDGPGTLIVATSTANVWPESGRVHVSRWTRNEHGPLVGLKTTSYAENVLALAEAHRHGCTEALFTNNAGLLCEGTGTNVFLVVDGVVVTPPLASGCLAGVTRSLAMEMAGSLPGVDGEVVERDIHPDEFSRASEAFLTSTTRDAMAISGVDSWTDGAHTALDLPSAPGPVTTALAAAFGHLCATTPDP
ncbi:MAG: aminotransferase class IV, partial [Acidimicrobiales bacterium]|nr:aminotransferase class IV [Acidimicrobiales bacterium]